MCKGSRKLCNRPICPILARFKRAYKITTIIKSRELYGTTPPSAIVGEYGYPYVNVGPNLVVDNFENAHIYDDPREWWGKLQLRDIIELRSSLIYSKKRYNVREPSKLHSRLLEEIQWAAVSNKPVDIEALLRKPPSAKLRFDGQLAPVGPTSTLEKLRVVSNPIIPRKVDEMIYDKDIKASEAVLELYKWDAPVYTIVRLFSLGLLGRSRKKRLVPTRWAITAVDKIIGDKLLRDIKTFQELSEILVYHVSYLGNHFEILLIPGPYYLEWIEAWHPRSVWVKVGEPEIFVNYEGPNGRARYMDGGYYAARLSILENLYSIRKQASVLIIREILPEYYAPVGNWHIRESVKNAFKRKPERPKTIDEALMFISKRIKTKIDKILFRSKLLKLIKTQKKLIEYIS